MKPSFWTTDRVSGTVLLGVALIVLWESRVLPLGSLQRPGPAFVPVLLASVLSGIAILVVAVGGSSPGLRSVRWAEARHAAMILATCVFVVLALERLGYRITIAAVLVFLLGVVERNRLVVVAFLALGFPLVSYWVFTRLGVILPTGPIGF